LILKDPTAFPPVSRLRVKEILSPTFIVWDDGEIDNVAPAALAFGAIKNDMMIPRVIMRYIYFFILVSSLLIIG
jgi:hypothetical protein